MTANTLDFLLQQAQSLSASELSTLVQALQKLQNEYQPLPQRPPLQFGAGKALIGYIAEDFDAPLDDFKEYMP